MNFIIKKNQNTTDKAKCCYKILLWLAQIKNFLTVKTQTK